MDSKSCDFVRETSAGALDPEATFSSQIQIVTLGSSSSSEERE